MSCYTGEYAIVDGITSINYAFFMLSFSQVYGFPDDYDFSLWNI